MENQEMKTGYIYQLWYNNRWTNNGIIENGFISSSAENLEKIKNEAFAANTRRNIRIVKFEYDNQKRGTAMHNMEIIKELSWNK